MLTMYRNSHSSISPYHQSYSNTLFPTFHRKKIDKVNPYFAELTPMKADVFAHLRTREDNRDSKQRPELHKYSINQLKQGHKHSIMRRHNTHRILKKVNSVIAVSTVEEEQLPRLQSQVQLATDYQTEQPEGTRCVPNSRTFSIKRRVEQLRKIQNVSRIGCKPQPLSHEVKSENYLRIVRPNSKENLGFNAHSDKFLGDGVSEATGQVTEGIKRSSSKVRLLVKNPFQKRMKRQDEFKQSLIVDADTSISLTNRCELQEMLALI